MLVSDIVISPSISGHHRISLNEGNILLEPPLLGWLLLLLLFVLLLLLLFFKDVNDWAPKSEVAEAITASVAAAMMMSLEKKKKKIRIFCLQFRPKTFSMTLYWRSLCVKASQAAIYALWAKKWENSAIIKNCWLSARGAIKLHPFAQVPSKMRHKCQRGATYPAILLLVLYFIA